MRPVAGLGADPRSHLDHPSHPKAYPMQSVTALLPMGPPSIDQLSRIIATVAAPAFLLGAVAAFIAVLVSRFNRVIDRAQYLHGIVDEDGSKASLKDDIPRLQRRAIFLS